MSQHPPPTTPTPGPDLKPPRTRRDFTAAELRRFVRELARIGNMTAAAAVVGRPVRSFHSRRRIDSGFAKRCAAALNAFRAGVVTDGFRLGRAAGGQRQLRQVGRNQIGPDEIARYLDCVAVSGNLALATRTIGRTRRAMLNLRGRDPAFAEAEGEAMKSGMKLLEGELVHSALAAMGEHGECEWLHDDEPLPEPAFPDMTAEIATLLLFRYWRRQERVEAAGQRWHPTLTKAPPPSLASDQEIIDALEERIVSFQEELRREETKQASKRGRSRR